MKCETCEELKPGVVFPTEHKKADPENFINQNGKLEKCRPKLKNQLNLRLYEFTVEEELRLKELI